MDRNEVETAKLQAETEEIKYRLARAKRADKRQVERDGIRLRAMQASVRRAEAEAEEYEISALKSRRSEQADAAGWRYQKQYNFVGVVDKTQVQAAIDRLHEFHIIDPGCEITLTFNSPGGSVIDGMALFDYIRFMRGDGHKITIIALGYAASMAGILLQAADHRVMAKGAWLLIHEVAFGAQGKIGEVEDMYEFGKRLKEQAAQIFVERSGGKLTREVLDLHWYRKDWWLDPTQALALGLIDEIK